MKDYSLEEMKQELINFRKKISYKRLEEISKVKHGCIGNFLKTGTGLSQKQFRKIRRNFYASRYSQLFPKTIDEIKVEKMINAYKPNKELANEAQNIVGCGVANENQCSEYQKLLKEAKKEKEFEVFEYKHTDKKIWLKIKNIIAKVFMRKNNK